MKNFKGFGWLLAAFLFLASGVLAKEKKEVGPNGGRLMKGAQLKAEFHVDKDRKAHVYLYDKAMKPVAPDTAKVTLKASKGGTQLIELIKVLADSKVKGSSSHLVSKLALPSPDGYLVNLSVKAPGKPLDSFRFNFDEHICGGCNHPEYACTCDH